LIINRIQDLEFSIEFNFRDGGDVPILTGNPLNPRNPRLKTNIDATFDSGLDEAMKTKPLFLSGCIALLSFAFVGTASAADTKNEQALRDLDAQWSAAAGAKDLDKTVSFYADDAIVLPPNEAAVTTKDGIRNLWKGFLDSLTDISWKTTRVEMSKAGDMACMLGTYELTMKDGTKDKGKYCEVWGKKADGKWKVGTDMFSSDLPATPATAPAPDAAERK
jgi:ketosteroid isomerase-like protein